MKNIVATLIILHNIESLFHARQLLPHKDDLVHPSLSLQIYEAVHNFLAKYPNLRILMDMDKILFYIKKIIPRSVLNQLRPLYHYGLSYIGSLVIVILVVTSR